MAVSDQVRGLRDVVPLNIPAAKCPSRLVLDHITSRWGLLVLVALAGRTLRWGELRRTVEGVSEKMLAQTLQTLERDGLVHRHALPVVPPHVEYRLTQRGDGLVELLLPLMDWLAQNSGQIVAEAGLASTAAPSGVGS